MDQHINLGSLAALLGGKLSDPTKAGAVVRGFRALDAAGPSDLAFLWDPKYEAMAKRYGYTLSARLTEAITNERDFLELVANALD